MTPAEIAAKYIGITVLPGHDSPFGPGQRWDGMMLDTIYRQAGIATVSFRDSTTAHTVLAQNGNIRKPRQVRPGDAVFLAHGGHVGIVMRSERTHLDTLVGWWPGDQGRRHSKVLRLDRALDILAVADPALRVKPRLEEATVRDKKKIADLLSTHPAVGVYVPPEHFRRAYARWQRYCGLPTEKVNGEPDERTLDRLRTEGGR